RESFAFVNLFPGTDALLHVSEISWDRVEKIGDVLHVGDTIKVKVIAIDDAGKVKVSAKRCLEKPEGYVEKKPRPANSRGSRTPRNNETKPNTNVERRVFKKKDSE
ncbi:MAG: S1 RNA-binding domain-containing protein, partial [Solobacterium sp.]|nr:S1 RNA-binding domain-containing protein [Solobacterium sp.]